ncbi:hypothetical protein FB45DRAFT_1050572 [Roridomyces roridus]|uniref:histidine kinase n=1 Tax=Roridomyces roridus TaxID=1738132 RepID=A0AAD7CJU5_9AGAR|nr:hypothetical protein FB45DRAFT_1050572 [Roridomyces roridus]
MPGRRKTSRPSTAPSRPIEPTLASESMQSLPEDDIQDHSPDGTQTTTAAAADDWHHFISAYACGRWEGNKIPRPPFSPDGSTDVVPQGALAFERARPPPIPSHRLRASFSASTTNAASTTNPVYPPFELPVFPSTSSSEAATSAATLRWASSLPAVPSSSITSIHAATSAATLRWAGSRVRVAPLALPSPEHELVDPMRHSHAVPIPGSHPEFPTTSSAHVHSVGHSRSGSITTGASTPGWDVMTPGGTRRARLSGFWSGTADVDDPTYEHYVLPTVEAFRASRFSSRGDSRLPTIQGSPATSDPPMLFPAHQDYLESEVTPQPPVSVPPDDLRPASAAATATAARPDSTLSFAHLPPTRPPPATAPPKEYTAGLTRRSSGLRTPPSTRAGSADSDERKPTPTPPLVNGDANAPVTPDSNPMRPTLGARAATSPNLDRNTTLLLRDGLDGMFSLARDGEFPPDGLVHGPQYASAPHSVPALTRPRATLIRQSSAPLPLPRAALAVDTVPLTIPSIDGADSSKAKPTKEEPRPGSSLGMTKEEARAAREEHAFATRGFLAPPYPPDELGRRRALYKFNIMGTGADLNFDRIAHLAKLVFNTGVLISVIDGEEEWFKSEWGLNKVGTFGQIGADGHGTSWNPILRRCALRTHDGFNIGCLALVDDSPREDFTPRQRHTLKEFAAIAMRELELWRDKIQLRIRERIQNSMEQFSRECLEIDSEVISRGKGARNEGENVEDGGATPPQENDEAPDLMGPASSMDTVYDHAAKLVQRTLDVEGVVVVDVSHCDVLESMSAESTVSVLLHHGDPDVPKSTKALSTEEFTKLNEFFARWPEGKVCEGIVPQTFRLFLPHAHIQHALLVPIYNVDKRPFALLCAWNGSSQTKRFLEGHELSYLRAIGVIILSAVLKRRMILADKAKSLFISNISHELRTPLHGILAAAELLGDSPLNHSQHSFLQTVQACGTSLVETVNHVLDFTKLSGNSKAGGVENVITPTRVDLMQLVEQAVDGGWIGHRARTAAAIIGDSAIGSVYSPPEDSQAAKQLVETVVDIGWRKGGWSLKCEKGGIRRVLMNVFGNSLKFTTNGYVHVILRELSRSADEAPDEIKVELVVIDTGKGISENFRRNQLFHPFSQENPLQTGTGLGLAIVNSIVKSESVNGKVEVSSEEGVGTEIKVTFTAQVDAEEKLAAPEMEPFKFNDPMHPVTVSLVGFSNDHKGVQLLHSVMETYLVSWWGLEVRSGDQDYGDIVILNEDVEPVTKATAERDTSRPFIILSTLSGKSAVMTLASEHEKIGGFCRVIYKPGGPSQLYALLKLCLHTIKIGRSGAPSPAHADVPLPEEPTSFTSHSVPRRNSEESTWLAARRPVMIQRSTTVHPITSSSWRKLAVTPETPELSPTAEGDEVPTINIGTAGTLLRSSVGTISSDIRRFRVLVVEDNSILRNLLVKWLTNRGYDHRAAVDGRNGVTVYQEEGPFDVVLLDMSMPILDGIGATTEIRRLEGVDVPQETRTRILALTGMSSLEDKRRAFEAGVDGYLVKPVAFKTLDEMFSKLGVS